MVPWNAYYITDGGLDCLARAKRRPFVGRGAVFNVASLNEKVTASRAIGVVRYSLRA